MATRKLVVVTDDGPLEELGGISGPIVSPTKILLSAITRMVTNGRTVYECNPADPRNVDKRVKLTISNMSEDNFAKEQEQKQEDQNPNPEPILEDKSPQEELPEQEPMEDSNNEIPEDADEVPEEVTPETPEELETDTDEDPAVPDDTTNGQEKEEPKNNQGNNNKSRKQRNRK